MYIYVSRYRKSSAALLLRLARICSINHISRELRLELKRKGFLGVSNVLQWREINDYLYIHVAL